MEIEKEHLEQKIEEFKNCEHHKVFRGKYEMQFLLEMLKRLIDDSKTTKQYVKEEINFTFTTGITNNQALSVFSPYAETPDTLIDYIKSILQ